MACLGNRMNEGLRAFRGCRLAVEDVAEFFVLAVDGTGGIVILLNDCAFQGQAREYSFGARVGQHLGIHLPIGSGGSVTTDWARRDRASSGQLNLAGKQVLET